jgi:apolipoprotein N-acyltransferase
MNCIRYWTVAPVIAGFILLSPIVAFLMVVLAELLIDVLMEAGTMPVCAVAIGAVGWILFRRILSQPDPAVQSRLEQEPDEGAIAVPPI